MVGKTEEQLTQQGVPYEVGRAQYREIARGQILGDSTGLLKLIFHRETRHLLGVHIIGAEAAELVHIGQAVLALGGKVDYFVEHRLQLPDAGGVLQDRRVRRHQPPRPADRAVGVPAGHGIDRRRKHRMQTLGPGDPTPGRGGPQDAPGAGREEKIGRPLK